MENKNMMVNKSGESQKLGGAELPDSKSKLDGPDTIYALLRPLLICMSIFGLYFQSRSDGTLKWPVMRIYCAVMVGILLSGIVYYIYLNGLGMSTFGPDFAYHVSNYLYRVLNVITAFVMYTSCYRNNGIDSIFNHWKQLDQSQLHTISGNRYFRKITVTLCLVAMLYFISSLTISLMLTFSKRENTQFHSALDILTLLWDLTDEICNHGPWVLPITLFCILSFGLTFEFCAFNKDFKAAIKSDGEFVGDFERYRRRHQGICNLVSAVDDNFCVFFGSVLAFHIAATLMKFYVILRHPIYKYDFLAQLSMGLWFTYSMTFVTATCLCGGLINDKAHAVLSVVHDCDLIKNVTNSLEIQVFLARLNGERIGFTVMKMFVVDKTAILTVFGILATYYIVLEQFQSTTSPCNVDVMNITSAV